MVEQKFYSRRLGFFDSFEEMIENEKEYFSNEVDSQSFINELNIFSQYLIEKTNIEKISNKMISEIFEKMQEFFLIELRKSKKEKVLKWWETREGKKQLLEMLNEKFKFNKDCSIEERSNFPRY